MPAVLADLCIEARWIAPMTERGCVLENHTLVVRDGRILDLLPSAAAAGRYAATLVVQRPTHLLAPGLINTHTHAGLSLMRAVNAPDSVRDGSVIGAEFVRDGALAAIAEMLRSGITCFLDRYQYPQETARAACEAGMRAVIGLSVASPDQLTLGLRVRDEYAGHPLISTVFAPNASTETSNDGFARVATLADELDAGIIIDLHQTADEIARSIAAHGMRPIDRLWQLGLLTPALNAVHMTHATAADVELAQRTGIAICLGLSSSLQHEQQLPPVASFAASGIRLGLGTGGNACRSQDIWAEMRLYALMTSGPSRAPDARHAAWDALAAATRGAAAALGLDADVGVLDPGKWADICCVDLAGAATQPLCDPVAQMVFCGGRDLVCDVWVAGRPLLASGDWTRLDWTRVAARANASAARLNGGG
jgi:5-methylthioadenosine/S-adenosylhomocysteine deaminase